MSCAKTAEPFEVLVGLPYTIWTWVGPRKHVLRGCAHWRHLANTIEPSMCSSDVACSQITLTTCLNLGHWAHFGAG